MKESKYILWGGVLGFLVVLYDYDFLLNPAGPETPITDFLFRTLLGGLSLHGLERFLASGLSFVILGSLLAVAIYKVKSHS